MRTIRQYNNGSSTILIILGQTRFRADWLGLGPWFRAHSKGGVEAHLFAIGYFLMSLVVSEI